MRFSKLQKKTHTGESPAQFVRNSNIATLLEQYHTGAHSEPQTNNHNTNTPPPQTANHLPAHTTACSQTEASLASNDVISVLHKVLQIRESQGKVGALLDLVDADNECNVLDEVSSARAVLTAAMTEARTHRSCTARMEARDAAHIAHLAAAERALHFVHNIVPGRLSQLLPFEPAEHTTFECNTPLATLRDTAEILQAEADAAAVEYLRFSRSVLSANKEGLEALCSDLIASEAAVHRTHTALQEHLSEVSRQVGGFVCTQLSLLRSAAGSEKTLLRVLEDGAARPAKEGLMQTLHSLASEVSTAEDRLEDATTALKRAQRKKDDSHLFDLQEALKTARRHFGKTQRELEGHEQKVAEACIKYYPELAIDEELRLWGGLVRHRQLKEYSDLEVLAKGRHAVCRARRADGAMVVLKQFSSSEQDGTTRLLREARALQRLNHPCITEVTCVFRDSFWYMEMPYYSGGDLAAHITKNGPEGTTRYLHDVSLALTCIHQNGIVHCDIKPENVFIGSDGGARLGDFDISKDTSTVTATMAPTMAGVRGTKGYIAPEVLAGGAPSCASDVFSFGLMIYDAVSTSPRTISEAVPEVLPHNVPKDAYTLLSAMLEEDPEKRPSAEQVSHSVFFRGNPVARTTAICTPVSWHNREARGEVVDVTASVKDAVQEMVTKSCTTPLGLGRNNRRGETHSGLEVVQVLRVEHTDLWEAYTLQRRQMHERLSRQDLPNITPCCVTPGLGTELLSASVNETHLFHGTQRKWANLIVSQGMDERVCSWGLNGAGLYFAENSSKSDEYMTEDADGLCDLFICRVLMGAPHIRTTRTTEEEQAARRPPCVEGHVSCKEEHVSTDSILAELQNKPREFVVYDRSRVYPEYLVKIRRTQLTQKARLVD